jgi:hypothetical protein
VIKNHTPEIVIRLFLIFYAGFMVCVRIASGTKDEFGYYPWLILYFGLILVYLSPLFFLIDLYFVFSQRKEEKAFNYVRVLLSVLFLLIAFYRFSLDRVEANRRYMLSVPIIGAFFNPTIFKNT